jgi:hypothetical protein
MWYLFFTTIPKEKLFFFQNHWIGMPSFLGVVKPYGKLIVQEMRTKKFGKIQTCKEKAQAVEY